VGVSDRQPSAAGRGGGGKQQQLGQQQLGQQQLVEEGGSRTGGRQPLRASREKTR
jgi:hypothetical protein